MRKGNKNQNRSDSEDDIDKLIEAESMPIFPKKNSRLNKTSSTRENLFDFSQKEWVKIGDSYVRNKNFKSTAKQEVCNLEPFEKIHKDNPQYYIEYSRDVCLHLRQSEKINMASHGYIQNQSEISSKMRAILIDWLIEVHLKFSLLPETLFLTVNLIDRYLQIEKVNSKTFQLVGVASMLIASKYEEIYAPEVRDFVYALNKTYTSNQIIEMEGNILSKLKFEVLHVSSYRFLERFIFFLCDETDLVSKIGDDPTKTKCFYLAQYLLELGLLDYSALKFSPSLLAASALFFARKLCFHQDSEKNKMIWTDTLKNYTAYSEESLYPCVKELCKLVTGISHSECKAIINKFSSDKYKRVTSFLYEKGQSKN
jgi:hypothetical protein